MRVCYYVQDDTTTIVEQGVFDLDVYEERMEFARNSGRWLRQGLSVTTIREDRNVNSPAS